MNKTLIAGLFILVLVIGVGSNAFYHQAEARGISKCWLHADGTVKAQYLTYLKSTTSTTKYPHGIGKTFCNQQAKKLS